MSAKPSRAKKLVGGKIWEIKPKLAGGFKGWF